MLRLFKIIFLIGLVLAVRFRMTPNSEAYIQYIIREDNSDEQEEKNSLPGIVLSNEPIIIVSAVEDDDKEDSSAIPEPRLHINKDFKESIAFGESIAFQASHFLLFELDLPPPIS